MRSNKGIFAVILGCLLAALAFAGGRGFRTPHLLEEHFAKHGHEFGPITQQRYLRDAQQLRDSRPGGNILESKRGDGGGAKFDRRRGWFVTFDSDGTIRTFFIPNDGIRYFERQARNYGPLR
ncbi:MAG TPA: hypothetical protein VFC21_08405 [Bryobacteraceae bacterium]|nr:hypothetical protein [Bryobacteraceae bacterium]